MGCLSVTCGGALLDHLILVVGYVSGQAASQENSNELEECYSKRYSCNDFKIGLHYSGHQYKAARCEHVSLSFLHIFARLYCALSVLFATAVRDAILFEVVGLIPVTVLIHPTAMQSPLDSVNSNAPGVCAIVVPHCTPKGFPQYILYLMPEDEARDSSHKLSKEHHNQEHCIQFEHPRASTACSKAAKQSKNNNGRSSPDKDIWCISAHIRGQGEIGFQAHLAPYSNS